MNTAHLKHRHQDFPTRTNRNNYVKQINQWTKLQVKSMNDYFKSKRSEGQTKNTFWPTIKPFLCNRGHSENDIFLLENEILICPHEVANSLNDFYVNIAADIGNYDTDITLQNLNDKDFVKKSTETYKVHPSIIEIEDNRNTANFAFSQISSDEVLRVIEKT